MTLGTAQRPDVSYVCAVLETAPPVPIAAPGVPPEILQVLPTWSARDMALAAIDLVRVIGIELVAQKKLYDFAGILAYGAEHGMVSRRRARRVQNMDALLETWVETIAGLATAHSHEAYTRADHAMDECLTPLLDAQIGDVRVFIGALTELLRADPRIPYIWWSPWASIVEPVVRNGPDGQVAVLRDDLARMVAQKAGKRIAAEDWEQAMAGALRWRSAEQLEKVGAALDQGGQPTIRGRQSCLFIEVPQAGTSEKALVVL